MKQFTVEHLKNVLDYDPDTGVFRWTNDIWSLGGRYLKVKAGDVAGTTSPTGYVIINIKRKTVRAHRLAWLYVYGEWPVCDIDHINGVRDDNRIVNLRMATRSQNCANSKKPKNNTSGFKGVSYYKNSGKWAASICVNYKQIFLGYYESAHEAHDAYSKAALNIYGEFARMR